MTVAIAPIQAKPPSQGSSADSAGTAETPIAGADFASLLLGQLAAEASLQEGITADLPTPAAQGLPDATVNPQDAAMLLAVLGMAPTSPTPPIPPALNGQLPSDTDTLPVDKDKKTSTALSIGVTANPDSGQLEASLINEPLVKTALPVPLESGDKAAKFAVEGFAPAKPDALTIKPLPNDSNTPQLPVSASLTANQPGNTALTTSAPLRVDTPVRDPAWSADFSQKVVWLTANDQKFAQLTLNPPQMGPIEISLNINKDTASAYFISPNAEVREAIETALPRLREMLAGVGIELGQANVGARSSQQESGNPEARAGAPRWITDAAILGKDSGHSQVNIVQRGSSMVDTFA